MDELYEFRVLEKHARLLFNDTDGQHLGRGGFIRKIVLRWDDPRISRVAELQRELNAREDSFFLGWQIHRRYSQAEIESADLLLMQVTSWFEPAGEECGTTYDESTACDGCGSGATKTTPLRLKLADLRRSDVAKSIANELIFSAPLTEAMRRENVSGIEFADVYRSRAIRPSTNWFEPTLSGPLVSIAPQTRVGPGPFVLDSMESDVCPRGDLLGINLVSELYIEKSSLLATTDFLATRQFIGVRRGLLRPYRPLLISQKVRRILADLKASGYKLEVARIVG